MNATTILSSAKTTLKIEPDGPVMPIGERCNALGYKSVRAAVGRGDFTIFSRRAAAQQAAGAQILNVNVVAEGVNEVEALPQAVRVMSEVAACPLSIDFANPKALQAALKVYPGRALINSVNGERAKMDAVFPVMKEFGAAAIALLVDTGEGIAMSAEKRVEIAERILAEAGRYGLGVDDFIFDCVVLGACTEPLSARVTFETMRRLRERLGGNITLGSTNAAFGLPARETFNAHFLSTALAFGCNVPITDPTIPELKQALVIGDVLRGVDEYAINYIRHFRATALTVPKVSAA